MKMHFSSLEILSFSTLFLITFLVILYIVRYRKLNKIRNELNWTSSIPGWPIVGNALEFGDTTDIINDLLRLIKAHGKILFLDFVTQPNIFCTDYDFIEFILSTHNVLNKSEDYRFLHRWLGTGLLTSAGLKWKKRRKITTPAFHFSILEQFVDSFESNGKNLIGKLRNEVGKNSVDIHPFVALHALDVICETAMGVSVDGQKNEHSEYVKNVKTLCKIGITRSTSIYKCNDTLYALTPDYYKEKKAVKQLHQVTYSVIDSRMKILGKSINSLNALEDDLGRKRKFAFLDVLLQSKVDGKPLSREDIREEVDTFMFAGHDTTSAAMGFALYLLSEHPDIQNRVIEEQKQIFYDDINRLATYNDLQQMKYLELVIKETLRLYPSVPMFGRCTDKDTLYKGNVIPKGINIVIFTYGVLRDPENFPDPDKFDPERFQNLDVPKKPFSYIPFSAGPRNCIGQKFAMLEMKSTISKILRHFELLPAIPKHELILASEAVLKSKNGIKIRLAERNWDSI